MIAMEANVDQVIAEAKPTDRVQRVEETSKGHVEVNFMMAMKQ